MAIDRPARDKLAAALAAYMRGEIDNFRLDEEVSGGASDDPVVQDLGFALWFSYDDFKSHPLSVTREGWEHLRHLLAFLRSDLELPPEPRAPIGERLWFGMLSAGSIAAAVFLAIRFSPWWLLLPAATVGVPSVVRSEYDARRPPPASALFAPFMDERQWRLHEPILAADRLPDYDPKSHDRPIRSTLWARVMVIPGTVLWVVVFAPLFSFLFLIPRRRRSHHD